MPMSDLVRDLSDWIEIPSVTGEEGDYGDALTKKLSEVGFDVERQEVAPGRFNLLARAGAPEVVFCTHLDTVPPFFGVREDSEFIYGRGSCDAKGQAVSQIAAGVELLSRGEDRVGFLFTVGEEIDSVGAAHANKHLADPWRPKYTIIGEPTGLTYCAGHKGIYKATLLAKGVPGHSSQAGGPSAIHELVGCCQRVLSAEWGSHPLFGEGNLNLGLIQGGIAPNVFADEASAVALFRTVEDPDVVEARLQGLLGDHVEITERWKGYAPVEFHVPEGRDSQVVAFGTDAPHMPDWGTPILMGPGAIIDAHTAGEKVAKKDLDFAVTEYANLAQDLLSAAESSS